MSSWQDVIGRPKAKDHFVHLYEDDLSLTRRVGYYLREGLEKGEGVIAIASPEHRAAFARFLQEENVDVEQAVRSGQLIFLDAAETLARFMVNGQPDAERFESAVGSLVENADGRASFKGLRAYGEMVDLLWNSGNLSAAIELEELWHQLLRRQNLPLLCAYKIDILGTAFRQGAFQSVLAIHTHLLPVGDDGNLEEAVAQAMAEVLGPDSVTALNPLIEATQHCRTALRPVEARVVWLSKTLPQHCDEILARARIRYKALCAQTGSA